jgi:L-ascorbate metabolism protein UlaG (beta-lactamase superfamily)
MAKAAEEFKKSIDEGELIETPLKGKVDIKWLGHAGFKIAFKDELDIQRAVYIDIWVDNKDCPDEEKKNCPNDADLILVTQGQLDHSMHAPYLVMAGKKEGR